MSEFGEAETFGSWDDGLPLYPDDVVRRWWRILSTQKPWAEMPRDDAFGLMRRVLSHLLNQAREPDRDARRYMIAAAREHGAFRRAQRCRQEDLVCEFGLVLDALDGALQRTGIPSNLIRDVLGVLDSDLLLAQDAATKGWHHATPDRPIAADSWFNRLLGEPD
jgi:hypothetical protein